MSWNNQITADDVLEEFTPTEEAVLNNIQGTADNLTAIVGRVVRKIRGQIKAGGNQVDQTSQTSLPDQLVEEAIAIARWKWLNSFPALKALKTKERETAAKEAEDLLKEIASNNPNRPRVELPAQVDMTPSPSGGTSYQAGCRRASRRATNGLI